MKRYRSDATSKKEAPVTGGAPSAENSKNTLVAEGQQGKPRERMLAELGLSAILSNTTTARMFVKATVGDLDLTEIRRRDARRPARSRQAILPDSKKS